MRVLLLMEALKMLTLQGWGGEIGARGQDQPREEVVDRAVVCLLACRLGERRNGVRLRGPDLRSGGPGVSTDPPQYHVGPQHLCDLQQFLQAGKVCWQHPGIA